MKVDINGCYDFLPLLVTLASLSCIFLKTQASQIEFGGVLRLGKTTLHSSNTDVQKPLQFAVNYAKNRTPWSLPRTGKNGKNVKSPSIINSTKIDLIHTYNDRNPSYFNDWVNDKSGRRHAICSVHFIGYLFHLSLQWIGTSHVYTHNFTISCPAYGMSAGDMFMYTHTFFVERINKSKSDTNRYLTSRQLQLLSESKSANTAYHIENGDYNIDHIHSCAGSDDDERLSDCQVENRESPADGKDDINNEKPELKYMNFGSRQIKIISYNIWNMNSKSNKPGAYVKRMERLRKTITDADADIIGLQEVRYEEEKGEILGTNQIETIAGWFPDYQFIFQPGQLQPTRVRTEEGVAILSRFPILSHDYHLLFINKSNSADLHQRVLLHAEVFIPMFGGFNIFVTHLSLSHEAREQSVVEIYEEMYKHEGPAILLGDLNAEPQEDAIQILGHKTKLDGRPGLIDVWCAVNGEKSTGFTYNTLERNLSKRIDYMYLKQSDSCCNLLDVHVLDDGGRGLSAASDHLPLKATLTFLDSDQN